MFPSTAAGPKAVDLEFPTKMRNFPAAVGNVMYFETMSNKCSHSLKTV